MGAWLRHRHHHVASAGFSEERELNAAAGNACLPAKITGFTSLLGGLGGLGSMTQRGCNVNRRRVSGHAILWRNLVNSIYI